MSQGQRSSHGASPIQLWKDDVWSRAKQLMSHHHRQFLKLDLDIEANPLESKFSGPLVDLMQREEIASSQNKHNVVEALAKKVFTGLCTETKRHCTMQSQSNQTRWVTLLEQQAEERRKFFVESFFAVDARFDPRGPVKTRGLTLDEAYEREERRLARDAFANYEKYETFNLDHSFGLQLARVNAEWSVYEQQMLNDYETQKATIMGKARTGGGIVLSGRQGPWKSKAEQKLLFNTAPVFSPEGGMGGATRRSQVVDAELQGLEKMFTQAKERIANQKKNAIRWIKRQEARMKIQVEGIANDRKMIYPYLKKADEEFDNFFAQADRILEEAETNTAISTSNSTTTLKSTSTVGDKDNDLNGTPRTLEMSQSDNSNSGDFRNSMFGDIQGLSAQAAKMGLDKKKAYLKGARTEIPTEMVVEE
ncbi:hypothetical protein TrLO_g1782 [Triparma laevis f. longispina]|uniref:Uncharacterized protein n=1 Tax=Triparma laevis f. longispina TaxID=1714387 RepID=A0A9W7FTE8_9STRA|nr:hypothetical protein TrLO_g1782 [Triparma laevis f. longispina]